MAPLRLERDSRTGRNRSRLVLLWHIAEQLDLLGMARFEHGTVAPAEEAAHAQALPREALELNAGGGEGLRLFPVDADGEIAAPILGEFR